MKKPEAETQQQKTEIEQLSQAELVELVLGQQKIIQELQELPGRQVAYKADRISLIALKPC